MENRYNEDRLRFEEQKRYEYQLFQRNRRFIQIGIGLFVSGIISFIIRYFWIYNESVGSYIAFISIAMVTFGIGLLIYRYLQSTPIRTINYSDNSNQNIYRRELEEVKLELIRLRKKTGTSDNTENLNNTINSIIENTLTEEFIQTKIDSVYSEKAIENSKIKAIYEDFENLSYRIQSELVRLRKSANLNLVIGTLTTGIAISALSYEVFRNELEFTNTVKLLSHYLPRLSLIIFIEIFAFFFLKLYKANLFDIKYFNNEKTNVDFKILSLKTAVHNNDKELIKLTISELVKTERNFKLGKGESTVEVEQLRSEKENNKLLSQILGKLTEKI